MNDSNTDTATDSTSHQDPEAVNPDEQSSLHSDETATVEYWKDLAQRMAAEADNVRRRSQQEQARTIQYAAESMIRQLLPVIDDLHAAIESSKATQDLEALRNGLDMIYHNAMKVMQERGVRVIDSTIGDLFDVDVHEALMTIPSEDYPEGSIVQIVQRGYALHDRMLRHAKVITSAGNQRDLQS